MSNRECFKEMVRQYREMDYGIDDAIAAALLVWQAGLEPMDEESIKAELEAVAA